MKKLAFIYLLTFLTLNSFSQSTKVDSILQVMRTLIGEPVDEPPKCNETNLRGKFHQVFINEQTWNDFAKGYDGKYIWIEAPETNWYEKKLGPLKSNKENFCVDPVMIDSTVISYYKNNLKGFKYDNYTYEIEFQDDGTVREFYEFYKSEQKVKSFILGWNETELLTITEFDFPGRI
jgi:hypothetical protein